MAFFTDPELRHMFLDGQYLILPSANQWEQILATGELNGVSLFSPHSVTRLLSDLRSFPELIVALGKVLDSWLPYVLLQSKGYSQRVQVLDVKCQQCSRMSRAANPWIYDIYAGASGRWEDYIERTRIHFPVVNCPHCGGRLPTDPIWAAPSD